MAEQGRDEFFVSYDGELSPEDRDALSRPGWTLHEDAIGPSTGSYPGGREATQFPVRQRVRLPAADDDHAMQLVIEALGRRPEGLEAFPADPPGF